MASRLRQSAVPATPGPSRSSRLSTAGPTPNRRTQQQPQSSQRESRSLPEHEAPVYPLNTAGRDALKALIDGRRIALLDKRMTDAIECLSENAVALNDAAYEKKAAVEKDRKRHDRDAPDDADDEARVRKREEDAEAMQAKVDKMTQQMEQDLRRLIDTREHSNSIRPVIEQVIDQASSFARENPTSTQPTQQSQRTRSERRARELEDSGSGSDGDDDYHDFTPTDPTSAQTQSTPRPPAIFTLFRHNLERRKDNYEMLSHRERYANDNDYRNFRSVLHHARNGDDAPPVPHESTWFTDAGAANLARPGETDLGAAQEDDSDDDLQELKATISTKCPLTLREFVEPLTSRKCPHSFEKEAILGMIRDPANRAKIGGTGSRGNTGGTKCVTCPASGCRNILTEADLHTDALLLRRIQRLQRAQREAEEEDDDENQRGKPGGRNQPEEIESGDSDDDGEVDVDDFEREERENNAKRIKLERSSGRPSTARR